MPRPEFIKEGLENVKVRIVNESVADKRSYRAGLVAKIREVENEIRELLKVKKDIQMDIKSFDSATGN